MVQPKKFVCLKYSATSVLLPSPCLSRMGLLETRLVFLPLQEAFHVPFARTPYTVCRAWCRHSLSYLNIASAYQCACPCIPCVSVQRSCSSLGAYETVSHALQRSDTSSNCKGNFNIPRKRESPTVAVLISRPDLGTHQTRWRL